MNACGTAPCTTKVPVQTLTGADGKSYRVDTYVTWQTVAAGRAVKLVTIVVRDGANADQGVGADCVFLRRVDRRVAT